MALSPVPGARIAALGHHLPATVLSTEAAAERLTVDAEWIVARTGIRERRLADPDETVADMATSAARHALTKLSADPRHADPAQDIDTVIVATSSAESTMPTTAARVAARLGLAQPAAFDLNNACAGFCHALAVADALIRAGSSRGALVIGADKASAWLDWTDRDTAILFADGAGAAVVLPHERRAIGPVRWGSVGERADLITIDPVDRVLRQEGRAVYRWATGLGSTAREVCDSAGVKPGDLAAFVPHQANLRIVDALARHLELDGVPVATDVVDTGNTMAATIPIALSRMTSRPEAEVRGNVLLFGFGAGLAYAGQVVDLQLASTSPAAASREPVAVSVGRGD
ncbi:MULTISPECIES: beta-ketoacyl-ACP synthase 3 [unclassified Streptomyces]|uniref:beta-ketoacyl-ACP synthase 3 n=1 Tax=unclassified Streptomyces TaxID=2593676 RepID=UPI002252A117|nr:MULTISPECIES: beta-ketoacyl-ACP synthase 3 [unclassified Streptomyces]MCX4883662.1 beta-ketoacyl-ACP synthase 3 [Streptomyces sp. NBC_00847]MCX5423761.1 beta-ketoacyl-ACP synthase 3 [Streptomyces sp. NBC_00078]